MTEQRHDITLTVNGVRRSHPAVARRTLCDFLRHDLGLTGTHVGCEHGVCGACTVLLDGAPVRSCLLFAITVNGRAVTTVEGLADGDALNPVQRADLKGVDAVELSRIILDPATLTAVPDDTVRPGGVAVKGKGWKASFGMATPPHEFELTLREFADPNGKQTYFSLSDPAPAVADELFRSRAGSAR